MAWCPLNKDRIAASTTNGDIAVLNVSTSAHNQTWGASESTRAVNRVAWHTMEQQTIVSAHQDGLIKMWDCRQKQSAMLVKSYHPRADAARDVQFEPTIGNLLATTFENGNPRQAILPTTTEVFS